MRSVIAVIGTWLFLCCHAGAVSLAGELDKPAAKNPEPLVKRFIVKPNVSRRDKAKQLHLQSGARVVKTLSFLNNMQVIEFSGTNNPVEAYKESGLFDFVEPEIYAESRLIPTDPLLTWSLTNRIPYEEGPTAYARDTYQWHLTNSGQPISLFQMINGTWNPVSGTEPAKAGACIHAAEAWDIWNNAKGVVISVIDSGIDYTHPDLAGVVLTNSDGTLAGISANNNGTSGSLDLSTNLMDQTGHGTALIGTMAANWNNEGIAGIAPGASILVAKTPTYALSEILICMDYSIQMKARIINCSWGFSTNSTALKEAFVATQSAGILCVTAVLNDSVDYDAGTSDYPTQWRWTPSNPQGLNNILAVTSTTPADALYAAAAWGRHTVDLGAPGRVIPTTGINPLHGYVYTTGTSIAAAITTACAALVMAAHPEESNLDIIYRLRASVDPLPDLLNTTISGGRLNLYKALTFQRVKLSVRGIDSLGIHLRLLNTVPGAEYTLQYSCDLNTWTNSTTITAVTSEAQIDQGLLNAQRFYRLAF